MERNIELLISQIKFYNNNMSKKLANTHVSAGISKKIKLQFQQIVDSMQVQLRDKNKLKKERAQMIQLQMKSLSRKINEFSSIIFQDNFSFSGFDEQPLIMIKYCQVLLDYLIQNLQTKLKNKISSNCKEYNPNKLYQVVQAKNLQNHDLRGKIKDLQQKLSISVKRAISAQELTNKIKESSDKMLQVYRQNFPQVCDLLKKAEQNQVQILQNNRFLNQEIQSLSIQFQRYKKNFKLGPNLKQKQIQIKNKLQRDYEQKLKQTLKQEQYALRSQVSSQLNQFFGTK